MSVTMTVTEKQDTCPFLNSLCKLYIKDEEMAKALMQGEKYRHRKRHEQKKKKCPLHWVIACTQSYEAFVKSARND